MSSEFIKELKELMGEGEPRSDSSDMEKPYVDHRSISTANTESSHQFTDSGNVTLVSATDYIEKDKEVATMKEVVKRYRRKNKRMEQELEQQRALFSATLSALQQSEAEANEEMHDVTTRLSGAIQVLVTELKNSNSERDAALKDIEAMEKQKIEGDFKAFMLDNEKTKLADKLEALRKESEESNRLLERLRKERDLLRKSVKKVSQEKEQSLRKIKRLEKKTKKPARSKQNDVNSGDECSA